MSDPEKSATGEGTLRERIREALVREELSVRELSQLVRAPERAVVDALPHVARSVKAGGGRLVVTPAECAACRFVFRGREKAGKPSRCPECRATRVRPPRFRVEAKTKEEQDGDRRQ